MICLLKKWVEQTMVTASELSITESASTSQMVQMILGDNVIFDSASYSGGPHSFGNCPEGTQIRLSAQVLPRSTLRMLESDQTQQAVIPTAKVA